MTRKNKNKTKLINDMTNSDELNPISSRTRSMTTTGTNSSSYTHNYGTPPTQYMPMPLAFAENEAFTVNRPSNLPVMAAIPTSLHGEGITRLSALARPFTSINHTSTLSPFSTPFRPSPTFETNSDLAARFYNTNKSPLPDRRTQSVQHNKLRPWDQPPDRRTNRTRSNILIPFQKTPLAVPEPTEAYLQQSLSSIQSIKSGQKLLLVIDLNGTLLYRPSRTKGSSFIRRPFAESFLKYALDKHKVMVWSSAKPHNVSAMCSQLFPGGARKKLVAEWTRENLSLTKNEYDEKSTVYKRLDHVWADPKIQATSLQSKKAKLAQNGIDRWNQTNTVLIDDTVEKARGQPYNLIKIPEFTNENKYSDTVLPVLIDYLEILKRQADVSSYIRKFPFDYETLKAKFSDPNFDNSDEESLESSDEVDGVMSRSQGEVLVPERQSAFGSGDVESRPGTAETITKQLSKTSLEGTGDNDAPSSPPYSPRLYSPQHISHDSDSSDDGGVPLPKYLP